MDQQPVDMAYLTRLAFDQLMQQVVRQTGAEYKGQGNPELVLAADPKDPLPFILLKRVGVWMNYSRYLEGTHDVFRGMVWVMVDGTRYQVAVVANETTLTIRRIVPGGG